MTAAACRFVCFYLASAPRVSVAAPATATATDSVVTATTAAAAAVTVTTAPWIIVVIILKISPSHFFMPIALSISVTAVVVTVSAPAATVVPSVPASPTPSAAAPAPAPNFFRARLPKPLELSCPIRLLDLFQQSTPPCLRLPPLFLYLTPHSFNHRHRVLVPHRKTAGANGQPRFFSRNNEPRVWICLRPPPFCVCAIFFPHQIFLISTVHFSTLAFGSRCCQAGSERGEICSIISTGSVHPSYTLVYLIGSAVFWNGFVFGHFAVLLSPKCFSVSAPSACAQQSVCYPFEHP
mmetsp:Transcript_12580/g.25140  ORF Transcript_12580/g.25140 Transcript_12580/m.25140 type:complete len:294 (-) Transcript_12580:7-888(-)